MKVLTLALALSFTVPAAAELAVGDPAPNLCYTDIDDNQVCTGQLAGAVQVLIYSTGWCPACNQEMAELAPKAKAYQGKAVVFLSLSAQGDTHGSLPDKDFLKKWRDRHNIGFTVAASPRDAGNSFFDPPYYIPAAVILDKDGKLAAKGQGMPVSEILSHVDKLLGAEE